MAVSLVSISRNAVSRRSTSFSDFSSARISLPSSPWAIRFATPSAVVIRWVRVLMKTRSKPNDSSRSDEHTSELQSLMRISYPVFRSPTTNHPTRHPHSPHIVTAQLHAQVETQDHTTY